jgi:mono/diheme cytochrome c family protein
MTSRSTGRRVPASFAFALVLLAAPVSHAQEDHAEGMRLFLQKGNCQACHGWAGDGRKMDNQMPDGSNLRESKLDRAAIILTIKCGRPGRSMPAFDITVVAIDRDHAAIRKVRDDEVFPTGRS